MVIKAIFDALLAGLIAITSLIPSYSLPTLEPDNGIVQGMYTANRVFPVATLGVAVAAGIGLRIILQGWDLIVFIYHQFWGSD